MTEIKPEELILPPASIPRPGERVRWFAEARPMTGVVQGHDIRGQAIVQDDFGLTYHRTFDRIRLVDPFNRAKPNWFDLPEGGRLLRPDSDTVARFRAAMNAHIPPGPRYQDLVDEIWGRGFEIFLVGGTVRDILSKQPANDIDLVTTMPLKFMVGFVQEMYRTREVGYDKRGYIRIGGTPASGDPFIDLKVFSQTLPGTTEATFGAGFARDIAFRDFTCNAVYYDSKNEVIIDPSGHGVPDSGARQLRLVCDSHAPHQRGEVFIRAIKFAARGFTIVDGTREHLLGAYLPALSAMNGDLRARYLIKQVVNKHRTPEARTQALQMFKDTLVALGYPTTWDDFFARKVEELLADV